MIALLRGTRFYRQSPLDPQNLDYLRSHSITQLCGPRKFVIRAEEHQREKELDATHPL